MHLLDLIFGGGRVVVHDRTSSSTSQGIADASSGTLSPQPAVSKPQLSSNLPPYIQLYQSRAHAVVYVPGAHRVSSGIADGNAQSQPEAVSAEIAGRQQGDGRCHGASDLLEPAASQVPASATTVEIGATPTADRTSSSLQSLRLTSTHEAGVENGTLPSPSQAADQATTSGAPLPRLKDCRSRACAGVVDSFKRALRTGDTVTVLDGGEPLLNSSGRSGDLAIATKVTAAEATADAAVFAVPTGDPAQTLEGESSGSDIAKGDGDGCPPDTWQLGRATWMFLHSVAAHYPEQPSSRQQELMRGMMEGLAEFYPCEICAEHLREQVSRNPAQVATAKDFNLWLCGIHNEVNEMLGKPLFDCSRLLERWRDGPPDGSCD